MWFPDGDFSKIAYFSQFRPEIRQNSPQKKTAPRKATQGGLLSHPGRAELRHLGIDRAIRSVRARQVAGGHEELVDDLAAREDKGLPQDLNTITTAKG